MHRKISQQLTELCQKWVAVSMRFLAAQEKGRKTEHNAKKRQDPRK
jgi:hypothetical protein